MGQLLESLPRFGPEIVSTLLLAAGYLGLRWLAQRQLRKDPADEGAEQARRLLVNLKSALIVLLLLGLFFIWAPEIRTFALSLTAFAVAIILATKELILCVSGTILRTTSGAFGVGDWIEVGGVRGEVLDRTLLSTTLQELHNDGPVHEFTGRTVVVPNSQFLTTPVRNERFYRRYVIHSFVLVLERDVDLAAVEAAVRGSLTHSMAPHAEVAQRYNALIERRAGIDLIDLTPRIRLQMTNEGRLRLTVSAFLPTREAVSIERRAVDAALAAARPPAPGGEAPPTAPSAPAAPSETAS